MKNVYDIKRENGLNYILSKETILHHNDIEWHQIVIVIYLYYEDTVCEYISYIKNIPNDANILFVTSNANVKNIINLEMKSLNKNYSVIMKKNRGRDISGLLVAARPKIVNYKYVCFVHDKKAKSERTKADTDGFIKCLWENMLGSEAYIYNVIDIFEQNKELGVLLPPEPISDNFPELYKNTWYNNFEQMRLLSERLQLECDLNEEIKPISVGTAFWARVDALKKLFWTEWVYEDFDEEPLPDDGTLSHAIERSFAYVAQDAGYNTGMVMNDRFAVNRLDYLQEAMTLAFSWIKEMHDLDYISQVKEQKENYNKLCEFVKPISDIYIYGAGVYGKKCLSYLDKIGVTPKAFLVSDPTDAIGCIRRVPVISISEVDLSEKSGIVVAVKKTTTAEEMINTIHERVPYYKNIFCFSSNE